MMSTTPLGSTCTQARGAQQGHRSAHRARRHPLFQVPHRMLQLYQRGPDFGQIRLGRGLAEVGVQGLLNIGAVRVQPVRQLLQAGAAGGHALAAQQRGVPAQGLKPGLKGVGPGGQKQGAPGRRQRWRAWRGNLGEVSGCWFENDRMADDQKPATSNQQLPIERYAANQNIRRRRTSSQHDGLFVSTTRRRCYLCGPLSEPLLACYF